MSAKRSMPRLPRLGAAQMRTVLAMAVATAALTGCKRGTPSAEPPVHLNRNMDSQDRYKAQSVSGFFEDGRTMRPIPEGTVARGLLKEDDRLWLGKDAAGEFVKEIPVKVDAELMKRGQLQYNIYCAPCHDQAGYGKGTVSLKGMPTPSYHNDRLRGIAVGHLYNYVTNGGPLMPAYKHQIQDPNDRWAVVAYLRALQRTQAATEADVPQDKKGGL